MSDLKKILQELTLPQLFVFDLDYTLWPLYCDTHISPPLKLNDKNQLIDRHGYVIQVYEDVRTILNILHEENITMAAASRTHAPAVAEQILQYLDLDKFFQFKELYRGTKLKHFECFKEKSKLEYNEMIFFDDEMRNINELSKIGVATHFIEAGLTIQDVTEGLKKFHQNLLM